MSNSSHIVTTSQYYLAGYLRVASLSVALFDFLQTLPSVRRFYREQLHADRILLSFVLFFLLQIISIATLTVSNVGFFFSGFDDASCAKYYFISPIFKVLQAMVSQAILGIRAYNLSARSRLIGTLLVFLYISSCALEWITNFYGRTRYYDPQWGNCRSIPQVDTKLGNWIYYVVAIIYDLSTTTISIFFLLKHQLCSAGLTTKLVRMMLYDGLGYFVALTAVNVVNLIIYHSNSDSIRTAAASLAYTVTWIMSQRLLLHLNNASRQRRNESINQAMTLSHTIESARQVSKAMRSQFESKNGFALELTVPDLETMSWNDEDEHDELGIEVRIETTFQLSPDEGYRLEDYSKSGLSRS